METLRLLLRFRARESETPYSLRSMVLIQLIDTALVPLEQVEPLCHIAVNIYSRNKLRYKLFQLLIRVSRPFFAIRLLSPGIYMHQTTKIELLFRKIFMPYFLCEAALLSFSC